MLHYITRGDKNYKSSAGYNRVKLICNGLRENGVNVKLHLLLFTSGRTKYGNFIHRYVISYFKHLFQLLFLLLKVNKKDVVILYDDFDQYLLFPLFSKKTNLIIEHTEYPYYEISYEVNNKISGSIGDFYSRKNLQYLKYASSVIVCSSYLKNYYKKYVRDIIVIPLLVDLAEYENQTESKRKEIGEYVAYCGSFNNNKDGLPILIDAFKIFHDNHPQTYLVLIGSGALKNIMFFKSIIHNYGLSDSVVFTGSLPHEEVGDWLAGAIILALARPNNRQAEGGVPSKVGEYLASGVPCVITRTGDLPNYLKDGIDCFLCEPDSVEAFAQRMEDCYQSDRKVVGMMAKEASKQFGIVPQSKRLVDFLEKKYGPYVFK